MADEVLTEVSETIASEVEILITAAPPANFMEDDYNAGYIAALTELRDSGTLAAHVALVVEQHTNGRTAELEARVDEWSAEYRKGVQSRDDWRARAEKAEATIARVRNALPNIEGINPASSHYDKGWDRGQQILTEHIQSAITGDYTRAALEGEQQ